MLSFQTDEPSFASERPMKLLLAIIQPTKLQTVREALVQIGVEHITVCDALGYGQQLGQKTQFRGIDCPVRLLRKIGLEIWVNDDFVEKTIETISRAARTGSAGTIGDGKIFVLPTIDVISIRSEIRGPQAIS